MQTCQSCKFWHKSQVCRRYPEFQYRSPDEWCGEYLAHEESKRIPDPEPLSFTEEISNPKGAKDFSVETGGFKQFDEYQVPQGKRKPKK